MCSEISLLAPEVCSAWRRAIAACTCNVVLVGFLGVRHGPAADESGSSEVLSSIEHESLEGDERRTGELLLKTLDALAPVGLDFGVGRATTFLIVGGDVWRALEELT